MTTLKSGDLIAVYGTLRVGERAEKYMRDSEYLGTDKVNGRMYALGGFPGFKGVKQPFNDSDPSIVVDVFSLDNEQTGLGLDFYEGYPNMYDRIQTKTESGLDVWIYRYNGVVHEDRLVESGDWQQRHQERQSA